MFDSRRVILVETECAAAQSLARPISDVKLILPVLEGHRELKLTAEEVVEDARAILDGFGDEDGVVFLEDVIVVDGN